MAENSAVGNSVTGTPYNGEALSYTLTGDAATAFAIDAGTGQVSVKEDASLDYEATNSYITVTEASGAVLPATRTPL